MMNSKPPQAPLVNPETVREAGRKSDAPTRRSGPSLRCSIIDSARAISLEEET